MFFFLSLLKKNFKENLQAVLANKLFKKILGCESIVKYGGLKNTHLTMFLPKTPLK